jgi:hypothetical protein
MDYKQKIKSILEKLKVAGIDRKTITKDLKYSNNYISQSLSKGGNKKLFEALERYAQSKLQNTSNNSQEQQSPLGNIDSNELRKKWTSEINVSSLINILLEEKDRTIKKAEEEAKKWETLYLDTIKENSKLLDTIGYILKGNLSVDNLNRVNQQLSQLNNQTNIPLDQIEQPKKIPSLKRDSEKKNKGN